MLSNQTIEGILFPQCVSFCGDGWERNSYANISTAITTWLFPWLVLVAQMPFQTAGPGYDILSGFLIIGSPVLAMYSLLVTFQNSRRIYHKCKEHHIYRRYGDRNHMARVAFILSACQQAPLFVEDTAMLACAIVLDRNKRWWVDLAARLQDSSRTFAESLWPQIAIVFATYGMTLAYVFLFEAGGTFLTSTELIFRQLYWTWHGYWHGLELDVPSCHRLVLCWNTNEQRQR